MSYESEGYEASRILPAPVVPDVTEVRLYMIVQIFEPYAMEI
jgi:hypothetical protein